MNISKTRGLVCNYAFILHALASLNNKGKAYIVVPGGVLFREATEGKIRKELIHNDLIEGVIALPSNLLTNTTIPVSVLILNKNKEQGRKGKITFIDAQNMGTRQRRQITLSNEEITTIISAYNGQEEIEGFMRIVDVDDIHENNLNVNKYFVKNEIEIEGDMYELDLDTFEKKDNHVSLNDVADLYRGINPPKPCGEEDSTHRLVQLSDVQESRIIKDSLTPVQLMSEHKASGYAVKEGDVIISARGSNVKMVLADKGDEGLILSNHFIGIRPKKGMTGECIKTYLESLLGQFYLKQRMQGSTIAVLKEKELYNMPFPVVENNQAQNIRELITEAQEQLKKALEEAHRQYSNQLQNIYDVMGIKEIIK